MQWSRISFYFEACKLTENLMIIKPFYLYQWYNNGTNRLIPGLYVLVSIAPEAKNCNNIQINVYWLLTCLQPHMHHQNCNMLGVEVVCIDPDPYKIRDKRIHNMFLTSCYIVSCPWLVLWQARVSLMSNIGPKWM